MNFIAQHVDDDVRVHHQGNGLFVESLSYLKKFRRKRPDGSRMRRERLRQTREGLMNERLFLEVFTRLQREGLIPERFEARKATRNQDEKFKIDAWILVKNAAGEVIHRIPIQIKSSWDGKERFMEEFGDKVSHIYVVIINNTTKYPAFLDFITRIIKTEIRKINESSSAPCTCTCTCTHDTHP